MGKHTEYRVGYRVKHAEYRVGYRVNIQNTGWVIGKTHRIQSGLLGKHTEYSRLLGKTRRIQSGL